jgi:LysM repeat protein
MLKRYLIYLFFVLFISGCATTPYTKPSLSSAVSTPGFYHNVAKGETLWRISKMYGINLEELASVNRITDNTNIEIGQKLLIPNYSKPKEVISYTDNDEFSWPVRGRVVTSFGKTFNNMVNKGINIALNSSSDVLASRGGRVVFSHNNFAGLGKTIILDHGDGFYTVYGFNSQLLVRPGDNIKKGTPIARITYSGFGAQYLHFEIRKGSLPQNPLFYLS